MLKEIHLAGSVRTPFGRFCSAFADISAVELGKAAVERSGLKPEDVKEPHVENILRGVLHPIAARQIGIGASSAAEWQSQWPLNNIICGGSGSQIAPPEAPRTNHSNFKGFWCKLERLGSRR